jgi:hypothetical protein
MFGLFFTAGQWEPEHGILVCSKDRDKLSETIESINEHSEKYFAKIPPIECTVLDYYELRDAALVENRKHIPENIQNYLLRIQDKRFTLYIHELEEI